MAHLARIYIAGPMTGIPQFNFPAFDAARDAWSAAGWEVVSPADMDRQYWRERFHEEFDVNNPDPSIKAGGAIYNEFLRMDIAEISTCAAIALLPGWQNSRGANKELLVARMLQLAVFDAITMERVQDATPSARTVLPSDAAERKAIPLVSGVLDYFPAALVEVARVSKAGNDQHNPGQPLHWSRGKSTDQADTLVRHLLERGTLDSDGTRHSAKLAWRALALLQLELEAEGAPLARGAREPTRTTSGVSA
jgi:hypothetical protein